MTLEYDPSAPMPLSLRVLILSVAGWFAGQVIEAIAAMVHSPLAAEVWGRL